MAVDDVLTQRGIPSPLMATAEERVRIYKSFYLRSIRHRRKRCRIMNSVVIAFQGTRSIEGEAIVKEMGVYFPATTASTSYVFTPPQGVLIDQEVENHVKAHTHKIGARDGEIPYETLPFILESITRGKCVYTKGQDNIDFLNSHGVHLHVINQCPRMDELPSVRVNCIFPGHFSNEYCAQRRAKKWGEFIISQMF